MEAAPDRTISVAGCHQRPALFSKNSSRNRLGSNRCSIRQAARSEPLANHRIEPSRGNCDEQRIRRRAEENRCAWEIRRAEKLLPALRCASRSSSTPAAPSRSCRGISQRSRTGHERNRTSFPERPVGCAGNKDFTPRSRLPRTTAIIRIGLGSGRYTTRKEYKATNKTERLVRSRRECPCPGNRAKDANS